MKRTALFPAHKKLGAKMVSFAGWEMPVSFEGILAEHAAVRAGCGIFDIGHMGIADISGKDAIPFLQYAATNDASKIDPLHSQYTILCNEAGGVIDDILAYKELDEYRLVLNASNTDKDLNWLKDLARKFKDILIVHRQDVCMLSLQGPLSQKTINQVSGLDLSPLKKNQCAFWDKIMVSRTGYTGGDGFEFSLPKEAASKIWGIFLDNGAQPCGLGARDLLRIEAGYPLYGHEYSDSITPLEAGYGWAVHFDKGDFVGKKALLEQKKAGLKKHLVGLRINGRAVPRQGQKVFLDGKSVGEVTSGTYSPLVKAPIALAFVPPDVKTGARVSVSIRDKEIEALVGPKNFLRG